MWVLSTYLDGNLLVSWLLQHRLLSMPSAHGLKQVFASMCVCCMHPGISAWQIGRHLLANQLLRDDTSAHVCGGSKIIDSDGTVKELRCNLQEAPVEEISHVTGGLRLLQALAAAEAASAEARPGPEAKVDLDVLWIFIGKVGCPRTACICAIVHL